MDLTDRWKALHWQTSEFSYETVDLLAELKKESKSALTSLLNTYKRVYAFIVGLTVITPLVALLKPDDAGFVGSIGLIWSYCLILGGFLTVKFARFKLPDLSRQTAEAIRSSLALVRSINSFQVNFVAFYVPVVFLGSLLVTLTYDGTTFSKWLTDPIIVVTIIVSTTLIVLLSGRMKRFMVNRQCMALIASLEEHLQMLEQP